MKERPIGGVFVLARGCTLNATSPDWKRLFGGMVVTVVGPTIPRFGYEEVLVLSPLGVGWIAYSQKDTLEDFEQWASKMEHLRKGAAQYAKSLGKPKIFGR